MDGTQSDATALRCRSIGRVVTRHANRRVLILATRVPLNPGDGTPSFVLDHAVAMSQEFDISILAPRVREAPVDSQHAGVRVRRFAYFPNRWENLADDAIMPQLSRTPFLWLQAFALVVAMFVSALREHRRSQFDMVHAQWIIPSGLVAHALRTVAHVPYIVTARGADVFRMDGRGLRRLKRRIINGSARYIGVSRDIAGHIDGLTVPVEVQPSGVDFDLWERLIGRREPEIGRMLFVGRLATKKGVADAIAAISEILDAHLIVVGDGPLRDRLESLSVELGVAERVEFLGNRSRQEVANEMRRAWGIIIPSVIAADGDRDGTPNVLGEAIAAEVPVIGSRIAGIAENIVDGATGLLFEPGDVGGLRDRISELIRMDDPSALANQAKATFREELSIQRSRDRYRKWYWEAMGQEGVR